MIARNTLKYNKVCQFKLHLSVTLLFSKSNAQSTTKLKLDMRGELRHRTSSSLYLFYKIKLSRNKPLLPLPLKHYPSSRLKVKTSKSPIPMPWICFCHLLKALLSHDKQICSVMHHVTHVIKIKCHSLQTNKTVITQCISRDDFQFKCLANQMCH